jgi:hypothetical protein
MLALLVESALRTLVLGGAVWVGLTFMRARNPHVHMMAWTLVLIASLSMPFLSGSVKITLPASPLPPHTQLAWPSQPTARDPISPLPMPTPSAVEPEMVAPPQSPKLAGVNWWSVASTIYAFVAGIMLLRLLIGIMLTWRLARTARPVGEVWASGSKVRTSRVVGTPVTFGRTILLPPEYHRWNLVKRQAVLTHEGSHVAHGDFFVLLLASVNRAVFWFSPFSWWQLTRLAELAEIISDDAALEVVDDRLSYADILLDLAQNVQRAPVGLAMARVCTVRKRVERILAASAVPAQIDWKKRLWIAAAVASLAVMCAGTIAYSTSPPQREALVVAPISPKTGLKPYDSNIGYYQVSPGSILTITREGDTFFAQLTGQRKLQIVPDSAREFSYRAIAARISFAANDKQRPTELILHQNGRELRATRIADIPDPGQPAVEADTRLLDSFAGWYEFNPTRAVALTRESGRLFVQETGRPKFEVTARGALHYVSRDGGSLITLVRDDQGGVSDLLLQEPLSGARRAQRIDAARGKAIEDAVARQIAAVPDRFKNQTPAPGSKEAVLAGIQDMQRGAPNYDRMSAQLASKVRQQARQLQDTLVALGAAETIFFRGVGPGGYDIYGVKFANGFAEFRVQLAADGTTEDVIFRPDGDDTPGGIVACSEEPALRSEPDTVPIKLLVHNRSGDEVYLFRLGSDGKRVPHGGVGDDKTSPILTYVNRPWVIADAQGRCIEIVIPGQRTRFVILEDPHGKQQGRPAASRSMPAPGSEEILRQYIDGLGRGEPGYSQMTPEVAAETRKQLLVNQAILEKLGPLRAMSFRGVSALGSDIYIAHFANGSAEWRIGLVKDGKIGRIALGPQY